MEHIVVRRLARRQKASSVFSSLRALAAVLALSLPRAAGAEPVQLPHAADTVGYWDTVEAGACASCHSLKEGEVDPGTAYIARVARTLNSIKSVNGGATPENLGCIFCHNRQVASTRMLGVLSHFSAQRSQHPVGRTFTGPNLYADTDNVFVSSYGSDTPNEMDCLDCHDAALVAPDGRYYAHRVDREANPSMLKGVTAKGQHDGFCRSCHGALAPATFKGKDIRVSSHLDGRDAANAIAEIDGTLLLTSDPDRDGTPNTLTGQCTICHTAHFSGNAMLLANSFANGQDCTSVCHLRGDRFDNYDRDGHGKQTSTYAAGGSLKPLAFACTRCHVPLDVSTPNSQLSPPRKRHVENQPINGDRASYKASFNLSADLLPTDGGTATGNPAFGVCQACHAISRYKAHVSYEGAVIGCQDCHDEHGEGTGTSNIFMIPTLSKRTGYFKPAIRIPPGVEAVTYVNQRFQQDRLGPNGERYDFYRTDDNGICDNTECHGTSFAGAAGAVVTPGPMDAFLDSGNHSGGDLRPDDDLDCESCHTHADPQGGWGAQSTCESCHASQGRNHSRVGGSLATHAKHATAARIYIAGCQACHAHDGKSVPPDTEEHGDGVVDFGGPLMSAEFGYTGTFDDVNCTTTTCHDVARPGMWRSGLGPDACLACHGAGPAKSLGAASAPTSGLHASSRRAHHGQFPANPAEEPGTATCITCHTSTPSTNHVDGTLQPHFPVVNVAPAVGFKAAAPATCAPRGDLAGCHADEGGSGRAWNSTSADPRSQSPQ